MQKQVITFQVSGSLLGIESNKVKEIVLRQTIMPIQGAPSFVAGNISVRHCLIPVIELSDCLDLKDKAEDYNGKILVVELAGITMGIKVDAILEVINTKSTSSWLSEVSYWQDLVIAALAENTYIPKIVHGTSLQYVL